MPEADPVTIAVRFDMPAPFAAPDVTPPRSEVAVGEPPCDPGDEGRARDGEDPGPHDAARDAPAHRRELAHRADADDRARDRVRRRYWDAEPGREEQGHRAACRGAEPPLGPELGDP